MRNGNINIIPNVNASRYGINIRLSLRMDSRQSYRISDYGEDKRAVADSVR